MNKILIFGDVTAPPFINNLLCPVLAFQRVAEVRVLEPRFVDGFTPTGAAKPAPVPSVLVHHALSDFDPDIVVCLGGGLFVPAPLRQLFNSKAVFAGFAFSDPLGLEASLEIAPEFSLFYTQDPQTVGVYVSKGIKVRRCDLAIDAELYHPIEAQKDCDILFYGKWTPYRDSILRLLAGRFRVNLHAHHGDNRWSVPSLPPLEDPQSLCEAINRSRLALEFAIVDDAGGSFRGKSRITPRAQFAAACGTPCLIDYFDRLHEFFEPRTEIFAYHSPEEVPGLVESLVADERLLQEIGNRARLRVLREQTWDLRVRTFFEHIDTITN